jgi:hypothetical protein
MLTVAAMLAMAAIVSLVVGIGLGIAARNAIPVAVGLVLALFFARPAWIVQTLARQSLAVIYERPPQAPPQVVAHEETTTLVIPRVMAVAGRPVTNGTLDVKLRGVKPDDARRMIAQPRPRRWYIAPRRDRCDRCAAGRIREGHGGA